MSKEFIIWGKQPGKFDVLDDTILYANANVNSMDQAEKVMDILKNKHGCHSMRVQVLDLNERPDFSKVLR